MRSDPVTLASAANMNAEILTSGVYLDQIYSFAVQAVWTGTAAGGTITLQGSNDNVQPVFTPPGVNSAANVTNWTTLTGPGSAAVSGAGSAIFDVTGSGCRWIRARFVPSESSAGSLTVKYNGKG